MSDVFTLDFIHMPWSGSKSSWLHSGAEAWTSARQTIQGQGERLTIHCPASGNPHLEGVLSLNSTGFQAVITVTGSAASPVARPGTLPDTKEFTSLFYDLSWTYTATSDRQITIRLEMQYHEKPEARLDHLLRTLIDLECLAVKVLIDIFKVEHTPPEVEMGKTPLQELMAKEAPRR